MRKQHKYGILLFSVVCSLIMPVLLQAYLPAEFLNNGDHGSHAPPSDGQGVIVLLPNDSAFVYEGSPNTHYGDLGQIAISKGDASGKRSRTFVNFDLSTLPSSQDIARATLVLTQEGGQESSVEVAGDQVNVSSTAGSVDYDTITWANQNTFNPFASNTLYYDDFSTPKAIHTEIIVTKLVPWKFTDSIDLLFKFSDESFIPSCALACEVHYTGFTGSYYHDFTSYAYLVIELEASTNWLQNYISTLGFGGTLSGFILLLILWIAAIFAMGYYQIPMFIQFVGLLGIALIGVIAGTLPRELIIIGLLVGGLIIVFLVILGFRNKESA